MEQDMSVGGVYPYRNNRASCSSACQLLQHKFYLCKITALLRTEMMNLSPNAARERSRDFVESADDWCYQLSLIKCTLPWITMYFLGKMIKRPPDETTRVSGLLIPFVFQEVTHE